MHSVVRRRHGHVRTAVLGATAATTLVVMCAACGGGHAATGTEPVRPLTTARTSSVTTDTTAPPGEPATPTTAGEPGGADDRRIASIAAGAPGPSGGADAELVDLLARYDRVLTDLYATAGAAADPLHPATLEWWSVVEPLSAFDTSMRTRIAGDHDDNRTIVIPGPEGVSWRHHLGSVTADDTVATGAGTEVAFTYCSHSPGVGVDRDTAAVLDDRRATSQGTGIARRGADGTLRLVGLTDESVAVDPPGTPDRCGRGAP